MSEESTQSLLLPGYIALSMVQGMKQVNGRGITHVGDKIKFQFDSSGRFDSFTTSCDSLEEFEANCGIALSSVTDHAFVYVHKFDKTTAMTSAYALGIKDKRLVEFYLRVNKGVVGKPSLRAIEPNRLIAYLETQAPLPMDDTVIERLWWVCEAQKNGLLDKSYPKFIVGMDRRKRWRAFRNQKEMQNNGGWEYPYQG